MRRRGHVISEATSHKPPPPPIQRRGPLVGPDSKTLRDAPRKASVCHPALSSFMQRQQDEQGRPPPRVFELRAPVRSGRRLRQVLEGRLLRARPGGEVPQRGHARTSTWTLVAHDATSRALPHCPLAGCKGTPGVPLHVPTAKEQVMVHHPAARSRPSRSSSRPGSRKYGTPGILSVETTWLFCDSDVLDQCMARVYYRCVFDDAVLRVPGWLKAFCDQRTRAELRATYGRWVPPPGRTRTSGRRWRRACWASRGSAGNVLVLRRRGAGPVVLGAGPARGWSIGHWHSGTGRRKQVAVTGGVLQSSAVVAHVTLGPHLAGRSP